MKKIQISEILRPSGRFSVRIRKVKRADRRLDPVSFLRRSISSECEALEERSTQKRASY